MSGRELPAESQSGRTPTLCPMYDRGQRVSVPNPHGDGEIEATFLAPGEADDAVELERAGARKRVDVAWISYADGTTATVPYSRIRPIE
jgi:hypothetical protein